MNRQWHSATRSPWRYSRKRRLCVACSPVPANGGGWTARRLDSTAVYEARARAGGRQQRGGSLGFAGKHRWFVRQEHGGDSGRSARVGMTGTRSKAGRDVQRGQAELARAWRARAAAAVVPTAKTEFEP